MRGPPDRSGIRDFHKPMPAKPHDRQQRIQHIVDQTLVHWCVVCEGLQFSVVDLGDRPRPAHRGIQKVEKNRIEHPSGCDKSRKRAYHPATHRRYDLRLHRIHVSPIRRTAISSLLRVSRVIIIGTLNRKPGRRLSSWKSVSPKNATLCERTHLKVAIEPQMLHMLRDCYAVVGKLNFVRSRLPRGVVGSRSPTARPS